MSPITFPGLGLEFTFSSIAINIGGKPIYWYGIIIAFGFLMAYVYCAHQSKHYGVTKDDVLDFIMWAAFCGIIGARIYYVIFYMDLYRNADGSFNWREAVAIWDGGLAVYGGIIAGVLVMVVMTRIKKISFFAFGDLALQGTFIGQAIGRWGNFCNREAHGGLTTLPWRMGLIENGTLIEVHPTFLYESLWNVVGLLLARFVVFPKKKFDGQIFLFYFMWYGLGRLWIEGLRTDSLYLFGTGIRVSQLLAGVTFLVAGILFVLLTVRLKPDPERLFVNQVAAKKAAAAAAAETEESKEETIDEPEAAPEEDIEDGSDH